WAGMLSRPYPSTKPRGICPGRESMAHHPDFPFNVQRPCVAAKVVYKTSPDPHNVPARPCREGQRLVPILKHRMTETKQPHTSKHLAPGLAVRAAAVAVLPRRGARARPPPAPAGGDEEARRQEEEVKRLQQQRIEQQKAMKGKFAGKMTFQAAPV